MINFSFILPSRNRVDLLRRLLDSVMETTSHPEFLEILLCADDDDTETLRFDFSGLSLRRIVGPKRTMSQMTRAAYQASRGRYVALINDDVLFRTEEWDVEVLKAFAGFPDDIAMVYPNDRYYGSRVSTFPILTRRACELMDRICPSDYKRHCIDSHIFDVFERLERLGYKRHLYLPNIVFEHLQFGLGFEVLTGHSLNGISADQNAFLSLAVTRQQIAEKMAAGIKEAQAPAFKKITGQNKVSVILIHKGPDLTTAALSIQALFSDPAAKEHVCEIKEERANSIECLNKISGSAAGDYLYYLESGALPKPGCLSALLGAFADDAVGVAGSRWIDPRTGRIEHTGLCFFESEKKMTRTRVYRGFKSLHPAVNVTRELQAVERCGMMIKKGLFMKVGGFASDLEGVECLDLCFKVRETGLKIMCLPQASMDYVCFSENAAAANLLYSRWGKKIERDLERVLDKDGFVLKVENGVYRIEQKKSNPCPSIS